METVEETKATAFKIVAIWLLVISGSVNFFLWDWGKRKENELEKEVHKIKSVNDSLLTEAQKSQIRLDSIMDVVDSTAKVQVELEDKIKKLKIKYYETTSLDVTDDELAELFSDL